QPAQQQQAPGAAKADGLARAAIDRPRNQRGNGGVQQQVQEGAQGHAGESARRGALDYGVAAGRGMRMEKAGQARLSKLSLTPFLRLSKLSLTPFLFADTFFVACFFECDRFLPSRDSFHV